MYGTGESWVFTFHDGDDLEVSAGTDVSDFYQFSNEAGIMVGGDYDSVPEGGPALKLTEQFMRGKSGISTTYDNRILCGI